ncbi:myrcene synthase, chloroplastic-like [Humulus lupulus]|uniref:myrcene synthase, chloroplastic-like n=1 Tax=Humulus lupulus TaxID=3486 RepID=UPI002B41705B|nr:myrcene synthase, chloroplastic-like [Humulus lupulus]
MLGMAMAVHPFSVPMCISTISTTARARSSACYPTQCTVVNTHSSITTTTTTTIDRRSANYEPPIWSFDYIQSLSSQYKGEPYTSRLNELKEKVKRMLVEMENSLAQFELIDTLQRLGLSYHFQNEINTILKEKYTNINNIINNPNFDLYTTALEFRLLRQYGYAVPQEIFNVFKDDETMKFKARVISNDDIIGVLALYEASFYGGKGESILEEARVFSTECLKNYIMVMMEQNNLLLDDNMILLVNHALELPLYWRITRSEARWFIDVYERRQDMNSTLLEFAKLDYNMVQSIYQEDLKHLSGWWRQTKLGEKMDFFRDRLMESFLWTVGVKSEPELSYYRRISGRLYVLITTIDDIYDVYGTLEELELFTNAVERWNVKAINDLPDYMRMPFFLLYNTINEMAFDVLRNQNFFNIQYLKKTWVDFCKHQLQEAKWFNSGYKPTFQEYIDNAWISVSGPIILVHAYFSSTNNNPITKNALKFLEVGYPNIIYQASIILRLADDLGTSPDEMKRGDIPKSIQCYMHDTDASEDEAREHIKFLISEAWKEMNDIEDDDDEDNSCFSKEFVEACKNLGRISQFIYQYGDGHASQDSLSKQRISELIINHIP